MTDGALVCSETVKRISKAKFGEGNGTLLQYSCLENPMDGGAWWATVHWVAELDTTEATEHARIKSQLFG